jgi:hypothetical protein
MKQSGLFGLSDHLKRRSAVGDPLQTMERGVHFNAPSPSLSAALAYSDGSKGSRRPYSVTLLKVLILAPQNYVSEEKLEFLVRDRLSWLRFLGFDLGGPMPDAHTIRLFRERLSDASVLDALFAHIHRQLKKRDYLPMGRADRHERRAATA